MTDTTDAMQRFQTALEQATTETQAFDALCALTKSSGVRGGMKICSLLSFLRPSHCRLEAPLSGKSCEGARALAASPRALPLPASFSVEQLL